jgi:hypothetical protein
VADIVSECCLHAATGGEFEGGGDLARFAWLAAAAALGGRAAVAYGQKVLANEMPPREARERGEKRLSKSLKPRPGICLPLRNARHLKSDEVVLI